VWNLFLFVICRHRFCFISVLQATPLLIFAFFSVLAKSNVLVWSIRNCLWASSIIIAATNDFNRVLFRWWALPPRFVIGVVIVELNSWLICLHWIRFWFLFWVLKGTHRKHAFISVGAKPSLLVWALRIILRTIWNFGNGWKFRSSSAKFFL
jgi:hypothetical protein